MLPFLRKLFFLKKLYIRQSPLQNMVYFWLAFILLPILVVIMRDFSLMIIGLLLIIIGKLIRDGIQNYSITRHLKHLSSTTTPSQFPSFIEQSVVRQGARQRISTIPHIEESQRKLYTAIFDISYSKRRDEPSKELFYTVLEMKLRRSVPHLVFDSHAAKGRQFRFTYAHSQNLMFEGDFNRYFTVYAPHYYQIDTLSFITPDVMQVMKHAHAYDIELLEDRLFLYGPLFEDAELREMEAAGERIWRELDHNLSSYRDSFLVGESSRQETAHFARRLMKTPWTEIAIVAILGYMMLSIVFATISSKRSEVLVNYSTLIIFSFFVGYCVKLAMILYENKATKESFAQVTRYGNQSSTQQKRDRLKRYRHRKG